MCVCVYPIPLLLVIFHTSSPLCLLSLILFYFILSYHTSYCTTSSLLSSILVLPHLWFQLVQKLIFFCESVHTQVFKQLFITHNFLPTQLSLILSYFHSSYTASCGHIIFFTSFHPGLIIFLLSQTTSYYTLLYSYT